MEKSNFEAFVVPKPPLAEKVRVRSIELKCHRTLLVLSWLTKETVNHVPLCGARTPLFVGYLVALSRADDRYLTVSLIIRTRVVAGRGLMVL